MDTLASIVRAVRSRRDRMEQQIRPILETFKEEIFKPKQILRNTPRA